MIQEEEVKPVFKIRNIANVQLCSTSKGVLCAVRTVITHDEKLYLERKDKQKGEYEYARLQPNYRLSLRPFEESSEVKSYNLHISTTYHKKQLLDILNSNLDTIYDKMYHRLSAASTKINLHYQDADEIIIQYYNDKRIPLGNLLRAYTK